MRTKRLTPLLAVAALAAALSLTSCAPAGTTHTVTIDGLKYSPAELTIDVGDTVVWQMASGGMPHDVVANDASFASELMTEGEFSHTFSEAGVYDYHCTPHPPMVGTVTVNER